MNTDSSQFITGREVAVLDMLNARDRRHAIQQELIRTHNATVISFTLNIPGPIKVFPLGEMTFEEGIRLIDSQLHAWKIPVLEKRTIRDFTGNEQFWSVKGDTLFIKEILCLLEDSLSFGRLFDIDVIRTDETKVSRTELGFPGRKCLLCSNDAFVCSRSRTHTVKELLDKACELMKAAGAKRALPLKVGGAFHSPLMNPAKIELEAAINATEIHAPQCPVYQNVDAKPHTDAAEIKNNLIAQLTSSVKWTQCVQNMIADGADDFTECGPGKALQGMIARIDKNVSAHGIA